VVDLLCEELVARGHDVTLFAAPGSRTDACLRTPLEAAHPDEIGSSLVESDCVACAWEEIDLAAGLGQAFDIVHDHSGFTALAMADRIDAPVVCTRCTGRSSRRRSRSISAMGTRLGWWRSVDRRR
jgi:Glycosyltransferase Family 4